MPPAFFAETTTSTDARQAGMQAEGNLDPAIGFRARKRLAVAGSGVIKSG
jgi:hypothetical protein